MYNNRYVQVTVVLSLLVTGYCAYQSYNKNEDKKKE